MNPQDPAPKILIARLSALGDVIQTLPVLGWVKDTWPEATIGWLVESEAAAMLSGHPMIDHLHVSHRKRWLQQPLNPAYWQEALDWLGEIRAVGYDMALDFQGLMKSALALRLTGIRHRVGFAQAREFAPLLYTQRVDTPVGFFDFQTPILDHFKALAQAVGADTRTVTYPLTPIDELSQARAKGHLAGLRPNEPVIALAPATQWDSKHWPLAQWSEFIGIILEETGWNIVLLGGPKDKVLTQSLLARLEPDRLAGRVLDLAGETSLRDLQAVLERVDGVIGPDSAPLHLAGAVGHARLIGLYGPTAHRRTAPPNAHHGVILTSEDELACQPCDQTVCPLKTMACMHSITPQHVFKNLQSLIAPAMKT